MLLSSASLVAILTAAAITSPEAPPAPREFPELRPRAALIGILEALPRVIPDPRSATDFILCPATRLKLGPDGKPKSWYVAFSINARTSAGGYAGQTMYGAAFKVGKPVQVFRAQAATDEGLDKLINDAVRKQMKDCPAVPNDQLAKLQQETGRPTVDLSQ